MDGRRGDRRLVVGVGHLEGNAGGQPVASDFVADLRSSRVSLEKLKWTTLGNSIARVVLAKGVSLKWGNSPSSLPPLLLPAFNRSSTSPHPLLHSQSSARRPIALS